MKSERVFPSTPTARSMRERCSGRARRLIAASACRKYHNWHYFTIPTAHSYKTIQSTPAPTRRHTPKLSVIIRFRKARQTNAQATARHTPAPNHAQADGEGRAPACDPNRCQTKRYSENSSFQTRRRPFFVVNIMPIMKTFQQGRGFGAACSAWCGQRGRYATCFAVIGQMLES